MVGITDDDVVEDFDFEKLAGPNGHALHNVGSSGYKLYFTSRSEIGPMVTNFIFQKAILTSLFSRFSAECGYKLYFVITLLWLKNKVCNRKI